MDRSAMPTDEDRLALDLERVAGQLAEAAQAADDWTAAGAREIPEWRRTY